MIVDKVNESYIRISDVTSKELDTIDEYFSAYVDGYNFSPKYKTGLWDGKSRFLNRRKHNTLPYGFIEPLLKLYYDITNGKKNIELNFKELFVEFNRENFDNFYKELNLPNGIEIRDYQQQGFEYAINNGRCALQAATGAGKSLILWLISKFMSEKLDKDVLIIVPQTQLVEQLSGDFDSYGGFKEGIECGKSTAKKLGKREAKKLGLNWDELSDEKALNIDLSKKIVVATWQTLQHKDYSFFDRFEAIMVDEVHMVDGKVLQDIISKCVNSKWRIGLTGTLKQTHLSQLIYTGFFSKQVKLITARELIDRGYATEVEICPIVLNYPKKENYKELNDEMNYLSFNTERIDFIYNLIKGIYDKGGANNILVLFRSVENGFWEDLKEQLNFVENLYVIHGKTPLKEREEARKIIDTKNNCIILASYSTFSTGTNMKNLPNIIFTESYKSMVKVVQSIGRGMRLHESKNKLRVFDITDRFKYKNKTYKQFESRLDIYDDFEFFVREPISLTMKRI